jgi:hypothetical protein
VRATRAARVRKEPGSGNQVPGTSGRFKPQVRGLGFEVQSSKFKV